MNESPPKKRSTSLGGAQAWCSVTWREGSNTELCSHFTAVRVRPAHRDNWGAQTRPHECLLIEWSEDESEPTKYFLSTAPNEATREPLVFVTKMRWRIERDYQDLKRQRSGTRSSLQLGKSKIKFMTQ